LIKGGDVLGCEVFANNFLTSEVVVHFDVFRTGMIDGIRVQWESTKIITPKSRWSGKGKTKFLKEHAKPIYLGNGKGHGAVLGFGAAFGDNGLLLSTPADKTRAKKNGIASSGLTIIRIPCLVKVTVGI